MSPSTRRRSAAAAIIGRGSSPDVLQPLRSSKNHAPLKLALFDLDGTLTRERSAWEYIHRRLGVWAGHAEKYQEDYLRGRITYRRFCELDARIWKGMKVSEVKKILREIPLTEGIGALTRFLRSHNVKLGIISSGLSLLADRVMERFRFDYCVANELGTTDGRLDGTIRIRVHYDQKGKWVRAAKRQFGTRKQEVLGIGDSMGDIFMFRECGLSVAFDPRSPELSSHADLCVATEDLSDVIPLLATRLDGKT
ncbi:MAG TPA: HAD-IB family phosphatase, partial [Thermodesulfobacteriota bacterium]|nr:HAD-IB family phosphatase [Thermodesulfobacteriota bacterium]